MKSIAAVVLFAVSIFAQYTKNDYELIKTTFLREFDNEIIEQYLNSGDEQKIKAALLSIAQSEDTTFAEKITKLDFEKFGAEIAFALGEIGSCKTSSDYILTQLQNNNHQYSVQLYEALGKTGTNQDLLECIQIYKETNSDGFPLAVYNFHIRGIVDTTESDLNLLSKNLKLTGSTEKLFRSLFALYRIAPDKINNVDLELILDKDFDPSIKLYALGILRKNTSFPFSFELLKKLISDEDWSVRCEAARTVCYFPFETPEQLDRYLNLLFDENPNVARTAAQSLVNIKIIDEELENRFLELLDTLLDEDLTMNVKGEILLALQNFYPNDTVELLKVHGEEVDQIYYTQMLGNYTYDPYYSFTILSEKLKAASDYEKFIIHSNLTNLYDSLKTTKEYANLILEQYVSETPLTIALYNFVIDSSFAAYHSDELKSNIEYLVDKHLTDTDYNQAISSLLNITDYIDSNFTKSILEKISHSKNYDLQYELRSYLELSTSAKVYREKLFDKLFSQAFEYNGAVVETNKGSFTIEFTPQVAPISVGSFVYLTQNNFFDDVIFHRVVPNFVIQTGDPTGTGWGGPQHTIVSEFSNQPFKNYYVGMASGGKDTEGSQWFVMQNHYPHLNGNYTNFGFVTEGYEVVNSIDQYDKVITVKLIK